LKSTAGVAGLTADELLNMATELQGVTTFGDEAIIKAQALLLTFKNVGEETFPAATRAILDMSEAMDTDLKSSTILVGKALNDPLRGLSALTRVGITFTKKQTEVIKQMAKTGDMAGAQAIIIEELNSQFGGQAQAAAETYTGKMEQMSNRFGDVKEMIGKVLLEALVPFIEKIVGFVEDHQEEIIAFFDGLVNVAEGVINALGTVISVVGGVVDAFIQHNPVIRAIIDGWRNLLVLFTDEFEKVEDKQIAALKRLNDNTKLTIDKFREFRDAVGLTNEQLAQMTEDFQDIEDPAQRVNAKLRAIKDGKYDTDTRKLSDEYKAWNEKLKATRQELSGGGQAGIGVEKAIKKVTAEVVLAIPEWKDWKGELKPMEEDMIPGLVDEFGRLDTATENMKDTVIETTPEVSDLEVIIEELNKGLAKAIPLTFATIGALSDLGIISDSTANALGGIVEGIGGIAAGIGQITSGDIIGGLTSLVGAIGSVGKAIGSLFKGKGELEAVERRLNGLTGLTKDWSEELETAAKEIGGTASAARAFNAALDDIISSSNISVDNFDSYIVKVREIVSTYEDHNASLEETEQNFGAAFAAMAKKAEELGLQGSASMIGLIKLADDFGLKIDEIADFKAEKINKAADGWADAVKVFGDIALPVLDDVLALRDKIADNQELINAIQGAETALVNLSAQGELTEEQFDSFEQLAVDAMDKLKDAGFTTADALSSDAGLVGLLEQIIFLNEEFGLGIDDTTQKLIDEAREAGVLSEGIQSEGEKQIEIQERMLDVLERIAGKFGVDIPRAMETMADVAERSFSSVIRNVDTLATKGGAFGNVETAAPAGLGFQAGTGGQFLTVPPGFERDNFPIGLSSGEQFAVVPREETLSGFGIQNMNFNVTVNAAPGGDAPGALVDKLYFELRDNVNGRTADIAALGVLNG
jgi:hypothetical protein